MHEKDFKSVKYKLRDGTTPIRHLLRDQLGTIKQKQQKKTSHCTSQKSLSNHVAATGQSMSL